MLVEVGKTYVNRVGNICKVVVRNDGSLLGVAPYYSYFPLKDGKENREQSFHVDRYGLHLNMGDEADLISKYELPDLKWIWCFPDKIGIWAYGGKTEDKTPEILTVDLIENVKTHIYIPCWRCYLGPVPEIKKPLVKENLWFCQVREGSEWVQCWVPEDHSSKPVEFSNFHISNAVFSSISKHKTTTTRYV